MKVNTGSTTIDRLRIVIGWVLAIAGIFMLVVVNSIFAYSNLWIWVVGGGLVVAGVLIAKSLGLMNALSDFK